MSMRCSNGHEQHAVRGIHAPAASYRYFLNLSCEFYPCHGLDEGAFNCLFCYCPLYAGDCPGEPVLRAINGHRVKDCSGCLFPHEPGNYDDMIRCLMERIS